MKGHPGLGIGYLLEGFKLIAQPGFRLFVAIPLLLNIALFVWLIRWSTDLANGWITSLMAWLPSWLSFLDWLFWLVYGVVVVMVLVYGFVSVANIIGAPFYGYLSELTEKRLTGTVQEGENDWGALLKSIPLSIVRELQKQWYFLPRMLLLLIIGLIPGINLIGGVLWFLFSAWVMAIQYVDYPADNHQMSFPAFRRRLSRERLTALGFGVPVMLVSMLPLINLLVIPAAVCGGTIYWFERKLADDSAQ